MCFLSFYCWFSAVPSLSAVPVASAKNKFYINQNLFQGSGMKNAGGQNEEPVAKPSAPTSTPNPILTKLCKDRRWCHLSLDARTSM